MSKYSRCISLAIVACGLVAAAQESARADLAVNQWLLGTGVSDPGNSQYSSASFSVVQNPLQASHTATLDLSYATSSYNFAWIGDSANFDAYPAFHLEQLDGDTSSEGRIRVTPSIDSSISLQGTFQYGWPGLVEGSSVIYVSVTDLQTEETLAEDSAIGGNVGIGPSHGTLDVSAGITLFAGREYFLYYSASIYHFDPTPPGTYGEGSGAIHLTITPVPEPAALALILPALLLPRRRIRR